MSIISSPKKVSKKKFRPVYIKFEHNHKYEDGKIQIKCKMKVYTIRVDQ